MRGFRRVSQFLIVAYPATDDVVARSDRLRFEQVEIVHPLLYRDEARAVGAGTASADESGRDRVVPDRVLGAVFVSGQVQGRAILEGIGYLVEVERNMWMNIARSSEDKLMRDLAERKLIEIELRQICGWLDEVVQQYAARHGRPPGRLADLVTGRLIKVLPEDPLGGRFFLDDAGAVQSTTLLDGLQNQHRNRLRNFLERFKKDHGRWPGALEELVDAGLTSALPPHPYKDRTWHYDPCTGEVY